MSDLARVPRGFVASTTPSAPSTPDQSTFDPSPAFGETTPTAGLARIPRGFVPAPQTVDPNAEAELQREVAAEQQPSPPQPSGFDQAVDFVARRAKSSVPGQIAGMVRTLRGDPGDPSTGDVVQEAATRGFQRVMRSGNQGDMPPAPLPDSAIEDKYGNLSVGMPDKDTPLRLLYSTIEGATESAPEMVGAVAGGLAGGAVSGANPFAIAAGAGATAAAVSAARKARPTFQEELRATPNDPDGAFDRAVAKTGIDSLATGLSFAAFEASPFKGAIKNLLFQAFGVQPTIAAGAKATENLATGKPVGEGVPEAAAQAVPGTLIPLGVHETLRAAGAPTGRTSEDTGAPPGEPPAPPPELPPPGPDNRPPPVSFGDDPEAFQQRAQAAQERQQTQQTMQAGDFVPARVPKGFQVGKVIRTPTAEGKPGETVYAPAPAEPVLYGQEGVPPRASDDLGPSLNELQTRTGVDVVKLVGDRLGLTREDFLALPMDARERVVAAAQRQESAQRAGPTLYSTDDAAGGASEGQYSPPVPPMDRPNIEKPDANTFEAGPATEAGPRAPQEPIAENASGGSERPFQGTSSAAGEHDQFFETRARAKAQSDLDDLLKKWAAEDAAKKAAEAEAAASRQQQSGPGPDAAAQERYKGTQSSKTAAPMTKEGLWPTDEDGYVVSDKGGPIQFPNQVAAARWILDHGRKSETQTFDRAVHPVGVRKTGAGKTEGLFTVREVGRTERSPPNEGPPPPPPPGQDIVPAGTPPSARGAQKPGPGPKAPPQRKGAPRAAAEPVAEPAAPSSPDFKLEAEAPPQATAAGPEPLQGPKQPQTLMDFLAEKGINGNDPALNELTNKDVLTGWRKKFARKILRPDAPSLHETEKAAHEAGFFGPRPDAESTKAYTNEDLKPLDEALHQHSRGEETYRAEDLTQGQEHGDARRFQERNRADLDAEAARRGLDTAGKSDREVEAAIHEHEVTQRFGDVPEPDEYARVENEVSDDIWNLLHEPAPEAGRGSARPAGEEAAGRAREPVQPAAHEPAAAVPPVGTHAGEPAPRAVQSGTGAERAAGAAEPHRGSAGESQGERGRGDQARGEHPQPAANVRPPSTEKVDTVEGKRDQYVMPGAEQSAKQAQAARGERIKPKSQQKEADHGMFGAADAARQGDLLSAKAVPSGEAAKPESLAAKEIPAQPKPATARTVERIHREANDLGIDVDTPEFRKWSKQVTGTEHLDDMDRDQLGRIINMMHKTEKTPGGFDLAPRGTRSRPADVHDKTERQSARDTVDHEATPAQKDAGNYQKGHVEWNGLDMTIETAKGERRVSSEVDENGNPLWKSDPLVADYGYFKRSNGMDGEGVDVFMGDHPESKDVWIIDQQHADTKAMDEQKVMAGFKDRASAVKAYKQSFSDGKGWARIKQITQTTVDALKAKLQDMWRNKDKYQRGYINLGGKKGGEGAKPERPKRDVSKERPIAGTKSGPLKAIADAYRRVAEKHVWQPMMNKVGWRFDALGKLPWKQDYMIKRYLALGKIGQVDEVVKRLYDSLREADPDQAKKIYDYMTTKGADLAAVPRDYRAAAREVKGMIEKIGQELVKRDLLPEAVFEANRGSYLPRLYLKHVFGEENMSAMGAGKKPSDMGYLKKRKDIDEETRMLILGEIQDPAFLAAQGVGKPMRDMAIMDFLKDISEQKDWVLPNSLVDWRGRKVSAVWLKGESKRVAEMAAYLDHGGAGANASARRDEALGLAREMGRTADQALEHPGNVPDDYAQVPDTNRYGVLRGLHIRKEIYDDLIGVGRMLPRDASWLESMLGAGGMGTKVTQYWKSMKVAMNPPTQVRNMVSNLLLLQLSGVSAAKIPQRVYQAVSEMASGGKYWEIGKKYGIRTTTFTSAELTAIHSELRDLRAREGNTWDKIRNFGSAVFEKAGDAYGYFENISKLAKIIDVMEKGGTEKEAALAAQQTIFDYSMVPKAVRYARNSPIGAPFLTWTYKATGFMLHTAVTAPWRLAPWIALPYVMKGIVARAYDVTQDDVDKLINALPQWISDKDTAYLMPWKDQYGRWQAVDLGYLFPWQTISDTLHDAGKGAIAEALKDIGAFGGPLPDLITAIKSGKDPFTGKDIVDKGSPPMQQITDWMGYLWAMAAPTWLTNHGIAQKVYQQISGTGEDRYGNPTLTPTQLALRVFGLNVYPEVPEQTRMANKRQMDRQIEDATQKRHSLSRDRSLSDADKEKAVAKQNEYIQTLRDKRTKYLESSEIHPNLETDAGP